MTNAVTGLCAAGLAGSAVVCIAGQHPTTEDGLGSFQEAYGSEVCRSFSKSVKRVLDWSTIEVDLRQAFREATARRRAWPWSRSRRTSSTSAASRALNAAARRSSPPTIFAREAIPRSVERAIEILLAAERPLIVAGDGVFWSAAAARATRLCRARPAYRSTPAAPGKAPLPEDHPLAIRGPWKKPFTGRADAVLAIGFRFWSGEKFGEAPTWNEAARYIQADATADADRPPCAGRGGHRRRRETRPFASFPKQRATRLDVPCPRAWRQEIDEVRDDYERAAGELERTHHDDMPIHPARIARELCEVIDRDATLVIDSFTMSGWMSQWFRARFPGQILDAGPLAPVGHGVGMAIGAQLARPGKQVVLVIGDGGIGISGFDLETARRYDLPIVAVLWNNSSWGPSFEEMPFLKGRTDPFDMLPNQRYDRMFEAMGCHGEHVERPEQFRPALERALRAGRTALINVIGDRRIGHPSLGGNLLGSTRV